MSSTTEVSARKAKKSFTLSVSSVAFLENLRKARRVSSASGVLEEIIQGLLRQQELARLEQAVDGYYSSLSDAELAEQASWGDFALRSVAGRST